MAEDRKEPKAAERRDSRGRFAPGNRGRPPGTRNRVTGKLHQIFGKGAEAVAQATLEAAEGGDMAAARLVLERLFPPRRPGDHYLGIEMPTEPAEAMATVIEAVAGGRLLPSEGEKMATLIRAKADLTSLAEIEQRLWPLSKIPHPKANEMALFNQWREAKRSPMPGIGQALHQSRSRS